MTSEWRWERFAEICEHSAFGPRFSGELYALDGNVATLRTTDISEDGRIENSTMPLAKLDLTRLGQHLLRPEDLVMTRSGRVGTAAVFRGGVVPAAVEVETAVLPPRPLVLRAFGADPAKNR